MSSLYYKAIGQAWDLVRICRWRKNILIRNLSVDAIIDPVIALDSNLLCKIGYLCKCGSYWVVGFPSAYASRKGEMVLLDHTDLTRNER